MSNKGELNEKQREVLNQVYDLLSEHFEAGVLVISDDVHIDDQEVELKKVFHFGGYAKAIGLLEVAKADLLSNQGKKETQFGD